MLFLRVPDINLKTSTINHWILKCAMPVWTGSHFKCVLGVKMRIRSDRLYVKAGQRNIIQLGWYENIWLCLFSLGSQSLGCAPPGQGFSFRGQTSNTMMMNDDDWWRMMMNDDEEWWMINDDEWWWWRMMWKMMKYDEWLWPIGSIGPEGARRYYLRHCH